MKRDELRALGLEDEAIESIMAIHGKDIQKYRGLQSDLDELQEQLAEAKKKPEPAPEPTPEPDTPDEYAKEIESLKRSLVEVKVKSAFKDAGLGEEDYSGLLGSLITTDADKSLESANVLISLINKKTEAVTKQIEQEKLKKTPVPKGGGGAEPTPEKSLGQRMAEKHNQKITKE